MPIQASASGNVRKRKAEIQALISIYPDKSK